MTFKPFSIRFAWCLGLMALFSLAFVPAALAVDPPAISVNPSWRPATQLSSLDSGAVGVTNPGDDLRYVDADIYINTSVQFWAAEVTCTVDKTVLETYTTNTDTGGGPSGNGVNAPDDIKPITYGLDIGVENSTFLKTEVNTVNVDGKINFAITRLGLTSPIGSNGIKTTMLLATLRYRTKILAANKTTALTCAAAFLDKNGKPVLVPTVVAPAPLSVLTGYTIKGKAVYQDQAAPTGILVECVDSANVHHPATPAAVSATGDFSITTRDMGTHTCYFYGSKVNADTSTEDAHLTSHTSFKLTSAAYNLLPVTLRTGNTNRNGSKSIDFNDFSTVTANWNKPSGSAFNNGDANGDLKTDKTDLALVAGNYGLYEFVNASHFIYSLPRDNQTFMNSHIWIGNYYGDASVSQFVPGTERNYWATLSPDGTKIAFTRNIGVGNADKFALFVAPVTGGVVGAAVNVTPNTPFDAFAPSWSPDSSTIAFICSYSRAEWTDGMGYGNLCLIGGDGKNLRQKIALPASLNMINIHPVAWYNNTTMMYGSPDVTSTALAPTCYGQICVLNLANMQNFADPNTSFYDDMPTIRWGVMGAVLFYRHGTGGTSKLHMAELDETYPYPKVASAYVANCASTAVNAKHCDVVTTSSILNFDKIAYFNVYTGNTSFADAFNYSDNNQYGLVFYTRTSTSDGGGTNFFTMISDGDTVTPTWATYDALNYSVNNVVGNPAYTTPLDLNPATENFLALRNTIEWVP